MQTCPRGRQIPSRALQQTRPGAHCVGPQGAPPSAPVLPVVTPLPVELLAVPVVEPALEDVPVEPEDVLVVRLPPDDVPVALLVVTLPLDDVPVAPPASGGPDVSGPGQPGCLSARPAVEFLGFGLWGGVHPLCG